MNHSGLNETLDIMPCDIESRYDVKWIEIKLIRLELYIVYWNVHRNTVWRPSYAALNFMYQFRMQNMSSTSNNIKVIPKQLTKNKCNPVFFPLDTIFNSIHFMSISNTTGHKHYIAHKTLHCTLHAAHCAHVECRMSN